MYAIFCIHYAIVRYLLGGWSKVFASEVTQGFSLGPPTQLKNGASDLGYAFLSATNDPKAVPNSHPKNKLEKPVILFPSRMVSASLPSQPHYPPQLTSKSPHQNTHIFKTPLKKHSKNEKPHPKTHPEKKRKSVT
ncbi:hypothetical protein [Granulicella sp. L60]|uniref:hypothetical protein n=1 Tax=Granulicella sp. L60 TaxID=1641866 RepID=UPI00131DEB6F|nr:hypothetical protein [Granulicella sp. L60]